MLRIVVAALGFHPRDHEAQVLARALRDAGHEVIFTGALQTPDQVVGTAVAEDADLVGLLLGAGSHLEQLRRLTGLLEEQDAGDIVVFGSGVVAEEDLPALARLGVARIFAPESTAAEVAAWVAEWAAGQFPAV